MTWMRSSSCAEASATPQAWCVRTRSRLESQRESQDGLQTGADEWLVDMQGPVKCVACADGYVACGGYDDCIYLFDLKRKKDLGALVEHQGAITCLEFFPSRGKASHLLSGAKDGIINVWEAGKSWEHLKSLKGHKKEISAIAMHSTGKLCMSTAKDGFLRLWDMGRGRCTFKHRLTGEGDILKMLPQGNQYALGGRQTIAVHRADDPASQPVLFHHIKDVLALDAVSDNVLLSGGEGGLVYLLDIKSGTIPMRFQAHTARLRAVCSVDEHHVKFSGLSLPRRFATASTDGSVRLWDSRMLPSNDDVVGTPLSEFRAGARITCMEFCKELGDLISDAPSKSLPKPKSALRQKRSAGNPESAASTRQKKKSLS